MAKKQVGDRTSRRGSKMDQNSQKKSKNRSNGNGIKDEDEIEDLVIPSSSSDSKNKENEEQQEAEEEEDEEQQEEEDAEDEEEAESKRSEVTNQLSNKKEEKKKQEKNQKHKKKQEGEAEEDTKNESALYSFPMNRINRIIKGESDVRITQEAVFVINKASEKFLQLFCKEGYACSFLDRKNYVGYNHLSSVVGKRRRFDFLSDFVPEKVKVEDALKEVPSVET